MNKLFQILMPICALVSFFFTGCSDKDSPTSNVGTSTLQVSIHGLPENIDGSILVTGPNNFSVTLQNDTLFEGVLSGTYTLVGLPVVGAFMEDFRAWPDSISVDVLDDSSSIATMGYQERAKFHILVGGHHAGDQSYDDQAFVVSHSEHDNNVQPLFVVTDAAPMLGGLLDNLTIDSCGFEDGRMLYNSPFHPYFAFTRALEAESNITMSLWSRKDSLVIPIDASLSYSITGVADQTFYTGVSFTLSDLLRFEIHNRSDVEAFIHVELNMSYNKGEKIADGQQSMLIRRRVCGEEWTWHTDTLFYEDYHSSETSRSFVRSTKLTIQAETSEEFEITGRIGLDGLATAQDTANDGTSSFFGQIVVYLRHLE